MQTNIEHKLNKSYREGLDYLNGLEKNKKLTLKEKELLADYFTKTYANIQFNLILENFIFQSNLMLSKTFSGIYSSIIKYCENSLE